MPTLPFITPDLLMSDSVAVVGSSDNLLGNGFGSEIDSFTDVVRFNQAPIDGYEIDVGSKTSMRMIGNSVLLCAPGIPDGNRMFVTTLRNLRICHHGNWFDNLTHNRDHYPYLHESNELFFFHYKQMELYFSMPPTDPPIFTSGLRMVHSLIAAGIVPCLFGFNFDDAAVRKHYWSDVTVLDYQIHDFVDEAKILLRLAEEGKIIIRVVAK